MESYWRNVVESITRLTIDYSDQELATAYVDFYSHDDGTITYEFSIRSVAGHRDAHMVIPMADTFSLMTWLSSRVMTWDARTLEAEFLKWKEARDRIKRAPIVVDEDSVAE
jgi:hypothetical protein